MRGLCRIMIALFVVFASCFMPGSVKTNVFAEQTDIVISGKKYEFDEKDHYVVAEDQKFKEITKSSVDNGQLTISGDLTSLVEIEKTPSYGSTSSNVTFTYKPGSFVNETDEEKWHLANDKSKEVNGFKLSKDVGKGSIIVQTSQDGAEWVNDTVFYNVLDNEEKTENFYTTKKIQVVSGCFYRITVAYELMRKTGQDSILFIKKDVNEKKKYLEVFEFYIHDTNSSNLVSQSSVSMSLGTKKRTEKKDGYYGDKPIDIKDPHYGWDLGHFIVSGYTDDTVANDGSPVFLKNVGDQVTLWFNLEQDIDNLNGNDNLVINPDKDGYDRDFEVKKTNFGRGALLIRKTDYQRKTEKPELYTNFLEANANTDANTVVGLFEEGDYEIALDYEIKNTPRQVAGFDVIPEYSQYTIRFKFSIRNSNCMVFPFDVVTGDELINSSITPNGFRLDLAKSRYLTINVRKYNVSKNGNEYVLDERFNRAVKDGDSYEEEGKYEFTVTNEYTGEKTTKTIYVGESPIIKALAGSGYSLSEINKILKDGGSIDKNGKVSKKQ